VNTLAMGGNVPLPLPRPLSARLPLHLCDERPTACLPRIVGAASYVSPMTAAATTAVRTPGQRPPASRVVPAGSQGTFDELIDLSAPMLRDVTFVVVDLETTGGSAASCDITEIGAVKVRGGVVLGELQTLVRPSAPIPPFIAVLTGITDAMVATAPRLEAALPTFLEFARGSVLVAHNAPFDLGFLRAGCERLGLPWPGPDSLDTARLARRVLTRDEAPN
jgi:DNA polymerase-3 subunit epsilon